MSTGRSVGILAARSIRNIRRLPSAFFPALAMPIFNMVVFAGTFFAVTKIPGFPPIVPSTGTCHWES